MDKRKWIVVAALLLLASRGDANERDLRAAREAKAWSLISQARQSQSDSRMLDYLRRFVALYPRGRHLSDAQYAMAETHSQAGRRDEALPYYEQLIARKDPSYLNDAWLRVGEIHYNSGEIAKARRAWKNLDNFFGKSLLTAEALYGMALCELRDRRFREGEKILQRIAGQYPSYRDLPKMRELWGVIRFNAKDYRGAVSMLAGIETPVAAFYRGMSHFQQQKYQAAAQAFQTLEGLRVNSYQELGAYLKAECFRMAQNDALAAAGYGEFISHFPDSRLKPYAVIQQARSFNQLGRSDEAEQSLRLLREGNPSRDVRAEALHLEVEMAAQQGEHRKAQELVQRTLSASGDKVERYANTYVLLGYYLLKVGKLADATSVLMELVRKVPGHKLGIAAYILAGQASYQREDWHAAISAFETALLKYEYGPLSDVAMTMMLASYFNAKNYQELVTHANRVLGVVSSEYSAQAIQWQSQSHLLIAEAYYALKQYPEASSFYERAMREPSLAAQAQLALAWSRYREGRYVEALRLARQVQSRPDSGRDLQAGALFLTACSRFNLKDYDSAISAFQGFRRQYPEDLRVAETWLHEGSAQRERGRRADALQCWGRLTALYPALPLAQKAQLEIGRLHFQARRYAAAAAAAEEFLTRWPQAPLAVEAQWLLAQSRYNAGHDAQAIQAFADFLARFPRESRRDNAVQQLMQARYRQAAHAQDPRLLAEFVKVYPKSPLASEAQYQIGQIAFKGQDWVSAIAALRKLLLDYPGSSQAPMALIGVAHAQERLRKFDAAIAEYRSLMELFPEHALALDAAMRAGALCFSAEKYQEAARSFRFVTERQAPADIRANAAYNLAVAYKKQRSYSEALEAYDRFMAAFPEDSRAADALLETASLHRLMERNDLAMAAYERLLKRKNLAPQLGMEAHAQIGELFRAAGDKDKAVESYQRLLTLGPANHNVRLVGLAQLAALYEEREQWVEALKVYDEIRHSRGQREWVRSATKRAQEIREYLEAQKGSAKLQAKRREGRRVAGGRVGL